jgi:hypothetical protein
MDLFKNGNFDMENVAMQLSHGRPNEELRAKIANCIHHSLSRAENALKGFNCLTADLDMIKKSLVPRFQSSLNDCVGIICEHF